MVPIRRFVDPCIPFKILTDSAVREFLHLALKNRTDSAVRQYLRPPSNIPTDSTVRGSRFENSDQFSGPWIPASPLKFQPIRRSVHLALKNWTDSAVRRYLHPPSISGPWILAYAATNHRPRPINTIIPFCHIFRQKFFVKIFFVKQFFH